jgi:alpha-L-rhamnosidase
MKKRYEAMVTASNITTLWEYWDLGFGSYNHAWSGGPLTLLSQYTVGVAPTSPGWRTYNVMPQEGRSLTHIRSTVPIFVDGKHDTIDISIEKVVEGESEQLLYKLFLLSPNNTVATVGIPRSIEIQDRACLLHSVRINNSLRWVMGIKQEILNSRDVDGVLFKAETDAYVLWHVISGSWQFEGVADCTVANGGEKAAL